MSVSASVVWGTVLFMVQGVGSVYNIYMLQILKHIFWLVVIIFLFLFNNLLGTFLGHMGSCNSVVETLQ